MTATGAGASTVQSPHEWSGTGLDFSFVREKVSSAACGQSEQVFLACVSAIQAMLDQNYLGLQLVPAASSERVSPEGLVGRYGMLAVTEAAATPGPSGKGVLQDIEVSQERNVGWRSLYRQQRASNADFDRLLEWVFSVIIATGSEEAYAAAAINGYIGSLDAHARIIPAIARPGGGDSGGSSEGTSYHGIGVSLQRAADAMMITTVFDDSPAAGAGLQPGDVIVAVDGEPVLERVVTEVVTLLRGAAGTEVELALRRGTVALDASVRRDAILVRNVSSAVVGEPERRWGHLQIRGFTMGNTCSEARRALQAFAEQGIDGIVLDLRDNLGGRIDQALCVADLFLEPGLPVMEIRGLNRQQQTHRPHTRWPATTTAPLVSLVNAGTGSASEVVVAALRDHGRAPIVGERTFGKATMQKMRPWRGSESVLQFNTVARMYTPSGHSAQMTGILPDVPADERLNNYTRLRLEDLFPSSPPADAAAAAAVSGTRYAGLRDCVARNGRAQQRRARIAAAGGMHDYPVYLAEDALTCLVEETADRPGQRVAQAPEQRPGARPARPRSVQGAFPRYQREVASAAFYRIPVNALRRLP